MRAAAARLKLEIEVFEVRGPDDFDGAFEGIAKSRVNAVAVTEDGEFAASFKTIAGLAVGNKLPSIGSKEYAESWRADWLRREYTQFVPPRRVFH